MRVALIGAGFHARTNLFPAMKEADFEIVAVTTRRLESAERALRDIGSTSRAYMDYTQMLAEEQMDAVLICLQPADQVEVVRSCLAAAVPSTSKNRSAYRLDRRKSWLNSLRIR